MTNIRIADTFTDSLARLTAQEQKAVKTTAFDLQIVPSAPGMAFHKLDRAADKNFWSVRVNADLRLIVHRTAGSLLLAFVGHHDVAYQWAERRKLERHPVTGAMQLIELVMGSETLPATRAPTAAALVPASKPPLFAGKSDATLLAYGVPPEWLGKVREATEETFFDLTPHLPAEAVDALIELAVGGTPKPGKRLAPGADPFSHPDARDRFVPVATKADLEAALAAPTSAARIREPSRPVSLADFEAFWAGLRSTLKRNTEIRGWGASHGYTRIRFRIVDVEGGAVTVASGTMSAPRRVSKSEFAKVFRLWDDYCARRVPRSATTALTHNSSYIIAIMRHQAHRPDKV